MKKQKGFTLVELIVVIVLLGILAAFAIPKYMSIDKEARASVVKALHGSVRSSSDMVHGLAIAREQASGAQVIQIAPGQNVTANNGYATASSTGIEATIADVSDFDITIPAANRIRFAHKTAATAANCCVEYFYDPTGGIPPVITVDTTGS